MTDLDLGALKSLAEAATPGPWTAKPDDWWWLEGVKHRIVRDTSDGEVAFTDSGEAEFIAAFNPVTVLALLARVRDAEEASLSMQVSRDNAHEGQKNLMRQHRKQRARAERAESVIAEAIRRGEETGYSHHKEPVMLALSRYENGATDG